MTIIIFEGLIVAILRSAGNIRKASIALPEQKRRLGETWKYENGVSIFRFCQKCGAGLPENTSSCPRCGAAVEGRAIRYET